jgi:hypothetical protein
VSIHLVQYLSYTRTWRQDANVNSGSYIWPSSSAPAYIPGFVTSTMLQFGSFVFAVAAYFLLKKYPYPVPEVEVRREPTELA